MNFCLRYISVIVIFWLKIRIYDFDICLEIKFLDSDYLFENNKLWL